jgi:nucleotide-binding universal stress UspA family protein
MYKRILVPTDGSDTAKAGVIEACKLAKALGAQVRLVHVVEPYLAVPPEAYGVAYDRVFESLRAGGASVLLYAQTVAKEAGVTAETRRGLLRIVMGSDAEYILHHTPVPMLLIREVGRYASARSNEAPAG